MIESRLTANETEHARAFASLRSDIIATRTQVDPCEIKISGIPGSITTLDEDTVNAVLNAIGCADHVRTILSVRRWVLLAPRPPSTQPTPGLRSVNNSAQNPHASKIAIVAKFCSPTVRDFVLAKSSSLKGETAEEIFGSGGDAKIHLNPILPPQVYKVWRKALN
ncbi:hypothetical protein QAD02_014013 [Eretmocerus hayati]|uniref:Uncharacterized protein n=1 Tax=Eretmocerus hayati TaxID=131215 RepID=A0ACC2P5B7_9HYME|nr:hypothetical protein QAD02_014013 [Eretmocerus hayati]